MNDNSAIELHPVDYTNNPNIIAQNNKMVSINGTIEVDLFGQCCSESIGTTVWGGSGGQSDFARGVTMCPDGKGFIVLKSTAKGGTISKIVPTLSPGASVTTGRNYVDHVVTEYGVVKLRGKSLRERALALISIAHPNFRDQLRQLSKTKENYLAKMTAIINSRKLSKCRIHYFQNIIERGIALINLLTTSSSSL